MNPDQQSIDDLHLAALVEFEGDEAAIKELNATYSACRLDYLAWLQRLRESREVSS